MLTPRPRRPWRVEDWPLRAKLAVAAALCSLVPVVVIVAVGTSAARARMAGDQRAMLAARADELVDNLDELNAGYLHAASRLAHAPDAIAFAAQTPGAPAPALAAQLDGDPAVRGVAILDATGRIRAATEPALVGRDRGFRGYARRALAGETTVSDPYVSETGVATVAYAAPIRDRANAVVGVAAFWVRADAIWDVARRANDKAGAASHAVLLDRDGIRIGHTGNADMLFHPTAPVAPAAVAQLVAERRFGPATAALLADVRPMPAEAVRARAATLDPGELVRGYAPGNGRDNTGVARRTKTSAWTVVYLVPDATLAAPMHALNRRLALAGALVGGLALLAALVFAQRFLVPLDRLAAATRALAGGDRAVRVRLARRDELGALGEAFDTMAERIAAQVAAIEANRADLERVVVTRTAELAASEARYRDLYETSSDMHLSCAMGPAGVGHIIDVNQTLCERLGYTKAELIGQPYQLLYPVEEHAALPARARVFAERGELVDVERRLQRADGSTLDASLSLRVVRDAAGALVETRAIWRDISLRKELDRAREAAAVRTAVEATEARLGQLVEAVQDHAIYLIDPDGRVQSWNPGAQRLKGYTHDEVVGRSFAMFFTDEDCEDEHPQEVLRRARHHGHYEEEGWRVRKDGSRFWANVVLTALRGPDGRLAGFAKVARDFTQRRDQEETLRASLAEREVLLQEIHHRVKNNLQVISSLIAMQGRRLAAPAARDALEECRRRVLSISLIHETLYQAHDFANVRFADYARTLVAHVRDATGLAAQGLAVDVAVEDITLPIDRAIPCGLVLNELITNAMKHGFPDGRTGRIRVELCATGDELRLAVADTGVGLPPQFDVKATKTMGMQLVATLARQLRGRVAAGNDVGARIQVTFARGVPS